MARYAVRPPLAQDRISRATDGRILLSIPPDPRTGATVLTLDPMDWLRRITNQIPHPKSHLVRYYGAYANRSRRLYRAEGDEAEVPGGGGGESTAGEPLKQMRVIAVITVPKVIDRILRHLRETGGDDIFAARAPPAA